MAGILDFNPLCCFLYWVHTLVSPIKSLFCSECSECRSFFRGKRLRDPLFSPYKRVSTFVLKKWKEEVFKSMQKSIKIV